MSGPDNQSCAMCLYWKQAHGRLHHGDCRKASPIPAGAYPQLGYQFPVTWHGEWCGSFSWGGKSQAPSGPPVPPASRDHGWLRPANEPRPVGNTHTISPRSRINIEGASALSIFGPIILAGVVLFLLGLVIFR